MQAFGRVTAVVTMNGSDGGCRRSSERGWRHATPPGLLPGLSDRERERRALRLAFTDDTREIQCARSCARFPLKALLSHSPRSPWALLCRGVACVRVEMRRLTHEARGFIYPRLVNDLLQQIIMPLLCMTTMASALTMAGRPMATPLMTTMASTLTMAGRPTATPLADSRRAHRSPVMQDLPDLGLKPKLDELAK